MNLQENISRIREMMSVIKERILKGFKDNSQIQAFLDRID